MTDEKALESTQEQPEVEEQPTPRVPSAPSEDKPTSKPKAGADDLDNLEAKIDSILSRREQSFKDRRIATLTEKVSKLEEILDSGVEASQPDPGRSKAVEQKSDDSAYMEAITAQILDGKGIAHDDPEYEALVDKYGSRISDPQQWKDVVQAFADRKSSKVAKQASVTPAASVVSGGVVSDGNTQEDIDKLASRLGELLADGKTAIDPNLRKERDEIRAQLNKLSPPEIIT